MAHYAKVLHDTVLNVIKAEQDFIDSYIDNSPGEWIQTSYNTRNGVHYQPNTHIPSDDQSLALRGNFAVIGGHYDREHDVFYRKQPYPSWSLNTTTWEWEPPVEPPGDGDFFWNETNQSWDPITK